METTTLNPKPKPSNPKPRYNRVYVGPETLNPELLQRSLGLLATCVRLGFGVSISPNKKGTLVDPAV